MTSASARLVCTLLLVATVAAAGCVTTDRDDDGGDGATFSTDSKFGLKFEGTRLHDSITPGTELTWVLTARNTGDAGENSFDYNDGCGQPWTIALKGPSGDVAWRDSFAQCQGFTPSTFVGGDSKAFEWVWDGREWNDGAASDAAPGRYTLTVGFKATHGGLHPVEPTGTTTFSVV